MERHFHISRDHKSQPKSLFIHFSLRPPIFTYCETRLSLVFRLEFSEMTTFGINYPYHLPLIYGYFHTNAQWSTHTGLTTLKLGLTKCDSGCKKVFCCLSVLRFDRPFLKHYVIWPI